MQINAGFMIGMSRPLSPLSSGLSFSPINRGFMQPGLLLGVNVTQGGGFRESALSVSRAGRALTQSIDALRGRDFNSREAISKNEDVLKITSGRVTSASPNARAPFSVDVLQLAKNQQNAGNSLVSNDLAINSGMTEGKHSFSIEIDSKIHSFEVDVSATDTNRVIQQRMANAVNNANIGVRAGISDSSGNSSLTFEGLKTGENARFSVNMSPELSSIGGSNITQEAQNARFRVNRGFTGALQTSETNDVSLGFDIKARLEKVGRADIAMQTDSRAQINAVRDMADAFNTLSEVGGSQVARRLGDVIRTYSGSFSSLGIGLDASGRMRIDEAALSRAAESGALERAINREPAGASFGAFNRLAHVGSTAARSPGQFVQATPPEGFWIPASPAMVNNMNRSLNTGMLFSAMM